MPQPTVTAAWKALAGLAMSPRRPVPAPLLSAAGITLDLSRQHLDDEVRAALVALAAEMDIDGARARLFAGDAINVTEGRAALHWLCRLPDAAMADLPGTLRAEGSRIAAERERMLQFAERVRRGAVRSAADRTFRDVVAIGIGGSALGPSLAVEALARVADGPNIFFVANIDGADLTDALRRCDPARTLFVVVSKTFTTDETRANAAAARGWLQDHLGTEACAAQFVAVTAHPNEARRQGYAAETIFTFPESVGGRFSLWSAVGLPIALACGRAHVEALLAGAASMDAHFRTAPATDNLPLQLALAGVWNRNFLGCAAHAVLPYAKRLGTLPRHLQQLEMESNGKSVDVEGRPVAYATAPAIFGEAGTNGQHSFHQWLHQGTDAVSADIVLVAERESASREHHDKLLANAFAQADCLWQGYAPEMGSAAAEHRRHAGGRPVSLIEIEQLDAARLGALIALYEHKVFCQGVLWHVNPFDQFGVERGKAMARELQQNIAALAPGEESVIARLRRAAGLT